ncbi:MAG: type I restriction endonuclease subunit R [Thermomicrobiales bacterium]
MPITDEQTFEAAIEAHLLAHGWAKGDRTTWDVARGLDAAPLFAFVMETQPKEWAAYTTHHGDDVRERFLARLAQQLDARGTLDVLRHGIRDTGVAFALACFRPASGLNPETLARYAANRLTVTRQLMCHPHKTDELDLALFLNGIPVATAELKNPLTRQTAADAMHQYRTDRDASAPIFRFARRALVHFAVDPDEVWMTTRLAGKETRFLPFNRGDGGGAGNAPNPDGYRTAYLWEEVWARDAWLDLLARFLHLERPATKGASAPLDACALIFPRYHQWDAVRRLVADARRRGAGASYLVQHSAGSGKSNTIAWLAHRLSDLHDATDAAVFDSVIVVTDRRVLDKQLQDTIFQFEHQSGVVQRIDQHSGQLAAALRSGTRIIITTLQKFPFVLDQAKNLPKRRYAVIIDEAHSSQTGEAAQQLKQVLAAPTLAAAIEEDAATDGAPDSEDELAAVLATRGKQPNLSYFAFTATPKAKTLLLFGTPGADGKPRPFHLYSMRQAIEEGFILDVLRGYLSYTAYYSLTKQIVDDPELDKKAASRAIAKYVALHPHNIAEKAEVMVEHYRQCVQPLLGGRAKAMVVMPSRLHAVRYWRAIRAYIAEQGYSDLGVLVAFSGTVEDGGNSYTEAGLNGFGERQLPAEFAKDAYHFLVVAEKYQTGFDQPLLSAMYVDKRLAGLRAVQTLSRLNRTAPGKERTVILDFVNDPEEIRAAFQEYYESATVDEMPDPNRLYDLMHALDAYQIYWLKEVEAFCAVFFKPASKLTGADQKALNAALDPAIDRYRAELPARQIEFRDQLRAFVRLYDFLCHLMPFTDADLEKRATFGRYLLRKLPRDAGAEALALDDEVALAYYRLEKVGEQSLALTAGGEASLRPPMETGTGGAPTEETARLSALIRALNERFGTDFTEADRLFFEQMEESFMADTALAQQAKVNTVENFRLAFNKQFLPGIISRMGENSEIVKRMLDDEEFGGLVRDALALNLFNRLKDDAAT